MVAPLDKAIERYIDGLPDSVQDILTGSNPTILRQAIELSATLTESQIRKNKLHRKGDKGKKQSTGKEENKKGKDSGSSRGSRKRKASQNFAVTAQVNRAALNQPAQPPAKKPYLGNAPFCNRCNGHHPPQIQCRQCTNCGRNGHLAATCRIPVNQNQAQPLAQQQGQAARPHFPPGSCYNCGDLTHYRNRCPRLANQNANQIRLRLEVGSST
ncbi:putative transcription factor interactor and regulator CCHC(Zn) family [Helianthus debilis subsp. tardiflorus]